MEDGIKMAVHAQQARGAPDEQGTEGRGSAVSAPSDGMPLHDCHVSGPLQGDGHAAPPAGCNPTQPPSTHRIRMLKRATLRDVEDAMDVLQAHLQAAPTTADRAGAQEDALAAEQGAAVPPPPGSRQQRRATARTHCRRQEATAPSPRQPGWQDTGGGSCLPAGLPTGEEGVVAHRPAEGVGPHSGSMAQALVVRTPLPRLILPFGWPCSQPALPIMLACLSANLPHSVLES